VGRPPLSRLRRRFGPLRGTQRRCAALRAAPPGRYATRALRAQPFLEHEKKADFFFEANIMSGGMHVHVGGGVERRTAHHQEQAAIREAIESGTAATVVPGSEDKHSTLQDALD